MSRQSSAVSRPRTANEKGKPELTLHYLPIRQRAEPLRYILEYANVPYKFNTIPFQEWGDVKAQYPNESVPALTVAGEWQMIGQSGAILRYLAAKTNLNGSTPYEAGLVDMHCENAKEVHDEFVYPIMKTMMHGSEEDKAQAIARMKPAAEKLAGKYNVLLGESDSGYVVGKTITAADLVLAEMMQRIDDMFLPGFLADYGALKAHADEVHNLSAIKAYREKKE